MTVFSPETHIFGLKGKIFKLKWNFSIHNELWYHDLDLERHGTVRKYTIFEFDFLPVEEINSTLYNIVFFGAKLTFHISP